MIKSYHLLIAFLIGALLCGLAISYWPTRADNIEDPIIHRLKEEIGWREFKEAKIKDSLKNERAEKKALEKDVITEREKLRKAEARYNEVRKAIPLTRGDTIRFLVQDTIACDSALLRARELAAGLTIDIITDNAIIKNLDSLNSDLIGDKKDLIKLDSLNQIEKKQLRKEARKKSRRAFFKGACIGAAIVAIFAIIF